MSGNMDENSESEGSIHIRTNRENIDPANDLAPFEEADGESEGSGEELFGDDFEKDYQAIPELDVYEKEGLDDNEEVSELSYGERAAVDREMNKRDKVQQQIGRMHLGLVYDESEGGVGGMEDSDDRPFKKGKQAVDDDGLESQQLESVEHLEDMKGNSMRDWILQPGPRHEIYNRFKHFLKNFTSQDNHNVYCQRIRQMVENFEESLVISFLHLANIEQVLAVFLTESPFEMFEILNEAVKDLIYAMFPKYEKIVKTIHVRITDLPIVDELRSLRQLHLNVLVRTKGVVTSTTGIVPQLRLVSYDCGKCGSTVGPFQQTSSVSQDSTNRPNTCPECQASGPFEVNVEKTVFQNFQRIVIQESPGSVPPGRLPRAKDVILLDDLVDKVKPGDEIDLTGVYTNNYDNSLNVQQGFPVFATVIHANHIIRKEDALLGNEDGHGITDDDVKLIRQLSKQDNIAERIVSSIAPSIFGHDNIKWAIALSLFGGVSKNPGNKHRIRGDINVLLCGDPGTAKSQFLKYVEQTAPRCVYTTGQGASAVGLTAYVHKSPITHEWTLEAGAMVLADRGHCLIDEFDKMSDQDRTSIHEALEQQSISISKAGIVTSLQARCAVIAAANPIGGRYDASMTFANNVDLTEPILSRFDCLCVVQDCVNPTEDARLAKFVLSSHSKNHPTATPDERKIAEEKICKVWDDDAGKEGGRVEHIPQQLLKKYLAFARERCHPRMKSVDQDKISRVYSDLRREALATGSIPITVRHIESVIRMAESHARMHLREVVNDSDVNVAIRVMLESFVSTQKFSVVKPMRRTFARYLNYKRDNAELLLFILRQLAHDVRTYNVSKGSKRRVHVDVGEDDESENVGNEVVIDEKTFKDRAKALQTKNLATFYRSQLFRVNNFKYDSERKVIIQSL